MKKRLNVVILSFVLLLSLFALSSCQKATKYSFVTNGGTEIKTIESKDGIETKPITTKENHIFLGWFDNAEFTGDPIVFPYKSKKDVTLYAEWEQILVNFETNGGSAVNSAIGKIEFEPVTVKDGSKFAGWYTTEDFSDARVIFPYTPAKSCTLYAKWETLNTYTVTFRTNGGLAIAPMVTDVINTSPETYLAGDKFLGWYLDADFTEEVTFPYVVTKDVTLYAKWENSGLIEEYTVVFETNGGNSIANFVGAKLESAPTPTKENAIFDGWYLNSDLTTAAKFPLSLTDDITLYAKWLPKQDITPDDIRVLTDYLSKRYDSYQRQFEQIVSNTNGLVFRGVNNYYIDNEAVYFIYPGMDEDGNFIKDENGNFIYFYEYVFYNSEQNVYHYYRETSDGKYPYNGRLYDCYVTSNPYTEGIEGEAILDALYLNLLSSLSASDFYKYDGKWYVNDEKVNEYAKIILGDNDFSNQVGNQFLAQTEVFSSLAFTFDANGVLTKVEAKSDMSYYEGSATSGVLEYKYSLDYIFTIDNVDNVSIPDEYEMFEYNETPSGLYPVLDDNNEYRKEFVVDETVYSVEDLMAAFYELGNYQAFYTLAGNRFTKNFLYQEQLIHVRDNLGKIELIGSTKPSYYYYDEETGATFYMVDSTVICDQYSYKNMYEYNQYLFPEDSLAYNVKLPTSNLYLIDGSNFVYDETEHCFTFNGTRREMLALGKLIFGDNDFDLPPYSEKENYNYIKVFLNNGKISKVIAASYIDIYDGDIYAPYYTEYFLKEVIVTGNEPDTFVVPKDVEKLYAPGEAKVNGTLDALHIALEKMGTNYTYTDTFRYVADDEYYGLDDDIYKYDGAKAQITSTYYYYINGVPYYCLDSNTGSSLKADNLWTDWGTPILKLLDPEWFYEGKDGNYYCKEEYLELCSDVISRYSDSKYYFPEQTSSYTKVVHLDFIKLVVTGYGIDNIYYSGIMTTTGINGSYNEIFSGIGKFTNIGSTTVTLPSSITGYDQTYPEVIKRTLDTPTHFSMSGEAVLSINPVKNATGYLAHVYLNGQEVNNSPFVATDGMSFKNLLTDGTYTIKLVATGDETKFLNSEPSTALEFVVSRFTQLGTPNDYHIDSTTKTLSFSEVENATRYVYQIYNGANLVDSGELTTTTLDLSNLASGRYIINIYAAGDNVNYRDGETLIIHHEIVEEGALSDIEEIFAVLDGSYRITNASSVSCVYNGIKYEYSYEYVYDKPTNRGRLIAKIIDTTHPDNDYSNPYLLLTIYYYEKDGVNTAKVVTKELNKSAVTTVLTNVDKPLSKFNQINIEDLKEKFSGKATEYSLINNNLDEYFENMSVLEEVFDKFNTTFSYTELTFRHNNWNNPNDDMSIEIKQTFENGMEVRQYYKIVSYNNNNLATDEGFNE